MEVEKKSRRALKLFDLILSHPNHSIPISLLDSLSRRHLSFLPHEAASFLLRHPHASILNSLPDAVDGLHSLLLLATPSRQLRLEYIRIARRDLGLLEDFEFSVVLANPDRFRLIASSNHDDPRMKYVEAVLTGPDDRTPAPTIETLREREYRSRGSDAEDALFAFHINFPPGFKIGKYYRIAVWKWQQLPYWSPYEDVSDYDLRSLEARRRLEKWVVATIHKILSLTVEKRTTLERIAHFRQAMGLPKKLKEFLLQHQGIFYVSTRGNQGKLHTVFLREEMVEPNEVYLARRKVGELLLMSPKKANLDRMLTSMGRGAGVGGLGEEEEDVAGDEEGSGSDSGVESQFVE